MRLAVYPDGAVVVSAAERFGAREIERFVARHAAWVERAVLKTHGREVIKLARSDISSLKRASEHYVRERAAHYAKRYCVSYKKIAVRALKSRWGSCSKAGNLSFNYKIAALPRELAEYIVVHEICHLRALNHSRAFWALVEQEVPDHKLLRTRLRSIAFLSR